MAAVRSEGGKKHLGVRVSRSAEDLGVVTEVEDNCDRPKMRRRRQEEDKMSRLDDRRLVARLVT